MRMLALLCLFLIAAPLAAGTLKPFKTDGCSLWIDGPPGKPNLWRHCCVAHDLAYWIGGTKAQRSKADDTLKQCIYEAQRPMIASQTTFYGVRMGGGPYWPMSYRWGFGWNYWDGKWPRGYKAPTPEEQAQIDELMPEALETVKEDALKHPSHGAGNNSGNSVATLKSPSIE
jgi:hypothetical protein